MNNLPNKNLPNSNFDRQMMQECIKLAKKGAGQTAPNPMVGSVIVKGDKIIGRGYHPKIGQPHAEIFALKDAGEGAKNATLYVNLEPCNHYGKTPPCTKALIEAQISKVVVGMVDCDPRVQGTGIKTLREAGIEVIVGVEEKACLQLNEGFIYRNQNKLPFGILKYAMTLDGKIASVSGHSTWVTNQSSRNRVHQLRSTCEAVIVGGNTVRKDNPQLTTHGITKHNPLRIVMSRTLDLPKDCNLWNVDIAPTIIFTTLNSNPLFKKELIAKGVEIIELDSLTPRLVMENLYTRGLCNVLWECGGILSAKALADGVINKIMAFIAPKIIGGENSYSPVGNLGLISMNNAIRLEDVSTSFIDGDILITGYIKPMG